MKQKSLVLANFVVFERKMHILFYKSSLSTYSEMIPKLPTKADMGPPGPAWQVMLVFYINTAFL